MSSMMAPSPQMPQAAAPQKPPQMPKTPEIAPMKRQNAMGALTGPFAGAASTFLTGPKGIDPATLSLGKSTLLGQ